MLYGWFRAISLTISEIYYHISTIVTPSVRSCIYTAHKYGPPFLYCKFEAHALQRNMTEIVVLDLRHAKCIGGRRVGNSDTLSCIIQSFRYVVGTLAVIAMKGTCLYIIASLEDRWLCCTGYFQIEHAVVRLVGALCYKPECRSLDSWYG
jgi:hypothetical protein